MLRQKRENKEISKMNVFTVMTGREWPRKRIDFDFGGTSRTG